MKEYIVWPPYLDCSLTRRLGRRVPRILCIDHVTVEDIINACAKLNLECRAEDGKKYPRVWYMSNGRVVVRFNGSKNSLLKELAKAIRSTRASGTK